MAQIERGATELLEVYAKHHRASADGEYLAVLEKMLDLQVGDVIEADTHGIPGVALSALDGIWEALRALDSGDREEAALLALDALGNQAAAVHRFYIWKRLNKHWGPYRDRGLSHAAGSREGGKRRSKQAAQSPPEWIAKARSMATVYWERHPTWGARSVAERIGPRLGRSPETVRRRIADLKPDSG